MGSESLRLETGMNEGPCNSESRYGRPLGLRTQRPFGESRKKGRSMRYNWRGLKGLSQSGKAVKGGIREGSKAGSCGGIVREQSAMCSNEGRRISGADLSPDQAARPLSACGVRHGT